MALAPGSRLGVYEVISQIGVGGMGQVYRATDTALGRQVAIKILPDLFASDPERLARFEREARTLASLNHPHIATIYAVERSAGLHALVMELVEGEDLSERIARGAIPIDEALPIAKQIAEALEAAHEQGIVHRDLKPANIKLRPDGTVKVLDFGLAKAIDTTGEAADLTTSPTITSPAMTRLGMLLGTAAYMSPEQAKGRPVDKRTDIWAFGCVLYEMLTGRRAFPGEDVTDTLASVLRGEPDRTALPPQTPPDITRLITRCLVKDRKTRLPDIAIAVYEIDEWSARPDARAAALAPTASAQRTRWYPPIAAALLGALIAGAAVWIVQRPAAPVVTTVEIQHTDGRTPIIASSQGTDVAIAPDGRTIAYTAGEGSQSQRLFVRSLDQRASVEYNTAIASPSSPFFSPDGMWVGFLDFDGMIKKVPASGGAAVLVGKVTQGGTRGGTWGRDGFIVFADSDVRTGLRRIPEGGGAIETLTVPQPGEYDHLWPHILPNGKGVLFTITTGGLAASDTTRIALLDLKTRQFRVLLEGGSSPHYAPSGHLVYLYQNSLLAVPFDEERLEIVGTATTVVDHVVAKQNGAADFDISGNGTLIYVHGESAPQRSLVWVEPGGHETLIPTELRAFAYPRVSPDGTRVALDIRDQEADTWILDLTRCTPNCPLTRLTLDKSIDRGVAWNREGTRVAFSSQRDGSESVYWQNADGSGTAERLTSGALAQIPSSFTPDGKWLLFHQPGAAPYDIFRVSLDGDHKIEPVLTESYSEFVGEVSPDGHWLAFQSNEAGSVEIYVRSYPNVAAQRVKVSSGGGATRPTWSRDGKKIYYFVEPGRIYAVPLTFTPTLSAGPPTLLFAGRYLVPQDGRSYDVSPKGERFLMIKDATPLTASLPRLEVVFNWTEELKRIGPRR